MLMSWIFRVIDGLRRSLSQPALFKRKTQSSRPPNRVIRRDGFFCRLAEAPLGTELSRSSSHRNERDGAAFFNNA
jgi:hypothetical protein